MRLVTFDGGFGRVEGDRVVPMGPDLAGYLRSGKAREAPPVPLGDLTLRAPIPRPEKVVGVGLNYRDHAAESGTTIPEAPVLFAKFANSVVGPGEDIVVPAVVREPDFEAELGVVIGRTARAVDERDALAHVAGYVWVNDVSARDLQSASSKWMLGRRSTRSCRAGPWLVTTDVLPDPKRLAIRCRVNGGLMQDSSTANMAFGVACLVSFISRTITLEPGDVIATGTPPGVGMARTPPRWLRDGDEVSVESTRRPPGAAGLAETIP